MKRKSGNCIPIVSFILLFAKIEKEGIEKVFIVKVLEQKKCHKC